MQSNRGECDLTDSPRIYSFALEECQQNDRAASTAESHLVKRADVVHDNCDFQTI